jgi:hypothetical protein
LQRVKLAKKKSFYPVLRLTEEERQSCVMPVRATLQLGTMGRSADDDELLRDFPQAPRDWTDRSGWDEYWRRAISMGGSFMHLSAYSPTGLVSWVPSLIEPLTAQGHTRLLFVGNGLSLTPWAFAHAGHQVVALDVSAVACEFLRGLKITDARVAPYFTFSDRHGRSKFEKCRREGGSVDLVCGDVLDHAAAPGPFDVIFSEASLQGFTASELSRAIRAIRARLVENGQCRVLVMNSEAALRRIVAEFESIGFHRHERGVTPPPNVPTLYASLGSG